MCSWSLDLMFKAKLKLESGNWKIQYGHQAAILKVTSLKINRLWPMATNNMHMKFEIEIPKQTWVTLRKPYQLQHPDTEKSNMATILKVTLLGINRLLTIHTSDVPVKFEHDIQSQTKVRLRKPKKSNMAARLPFWKWHRWKSIGFCP